MRRKKLYLAMVVLFLFVLGVTAFLLWLLRADSVPTVPANPAYLDESLPLEERVADLLSYMTLEEKIGQMTLIEKNSISPADVTKYTLGGILSSAGSKPEVNTTEGWKTLTKRYKDAAQSTRLGIPLFYGVDAVHGHGHLPGATVFPHAIGLGATHDAELVEQINIATAKELRATGINWNYAPTLDLPHDIRWGRVYEAYTSDSELAATLGVAAVKGLQHEQSPVLATPKHFVGLGAMEWNSSFNKNFRIDQGFTDANETLLRAEYLPPFKASIDAGALSIMVGLNAWGDGRMVLQKQLLTDVLKTELGFKGFLVSDWYGVHEGRKNIFGATVAAVNAGVDMLMLPFDYKAFHIHMKIANRLGIISDERINDAAGRILYAKFALGLFDQSLPDPEGNVIGNEQHRALAREAVAKSAVLLKSEGVPIIPPGTKTIRVAGSAADNTGRQSGAWTIDWQGVDGNKVPGATSILDGIKARAGNIQVEYDLQGEFSEFSKADIGIAIVGETPYAEGWGDKEYPVLSASDIATIENLKKHAMRVVVIVVSGRPLLIADEVDSWDTLIAVWLPGSEGEGVADVLFGDKPFTGKLPMSWPYTSEQLPIAADDTTLDGTKVLFNRGFGLTTQ